MSCSKYDFVYGKININARYLFYTAYRTPVDSLKRVSNIAKVEYLQPSSAPGKKKCTIGRHYSDFIDIYWFTGYIQNSRIHSN